MTMTIGSGTYGQRAYGYASRQTTAPAQQSPSESNQVNQGDSVELSTEYTQNLKHPKIGDMIDRETNPAPTLDELDSMVRQELDAFDDMMNGARENVGIPEGGTTSILTFGDEGSFSYIIITSRFERLPEGKFEQSDGSFSVFDDRPGSTSSTTGSFTAGGAAISVPAGSGEDEEEELHRVSNELYARISEQNVTQKIQRLSALSSISHLAETNEAFREMYNADPKSALSHFN
ncbi:MAG: hypothetical protein LIQ30_07105, partial [Planctomycetes bacterium]|nr:hypothetical protein [Planctomycetota bacterium]